MQSLFIGLVVAASFLCTNVALAQPQIVEKVVAVVNDDAIFLSEIRKRAIPLLPQIVQSGDTETQMKRLDEVQKQLLETLINERLLSQQAAELGIRVTDLQVEQSIQNWRQQNNLSEEQLWETVKGQGLTRAEYYEEMRRYITHYKVIGKKVRGRVNITEKDVRDRYLERVRKANRQLRFHPLHIVVRVASGAPATEVSAARAKAELVRKDLSADSFAAAIAEYSGGDLGWLQQGDLPAVLSNELARMNAGDISEPIRGPAGFYIFLLKDKDRGGANIPEFEELKDQLYQQMMNAEMGRQQQLFVKELREKASIRKML